jgi:hypothetical protein
LEVSHPVDQVVVGGGGQRLPLHSEAVKVAIGDEVESVRTVEGIEHDQGSDQAVDDGSRRVVEQRCPCGLCGTGLGGPNKGDNRVEISLIWLGIRSHRRA